MSTPMPCRPILLVEDNPMDVDLTLQSFEEHAVANPIVVCRDGEEALQYIDNHTVVDDPALPLVMLLDLRLPKVEGLDVLRHARKQAAWRAITIVVLTTSRESSDVATATQLGASAYIVKPVEFVAFSDVIKDVKARWLLVDDPPTSPGAGGSP